MKRAIKKTLGLTLLASIVAVSTLASLTLADPPPHRRAPRVPPPGYGPRPRPPVIVQPTPPPPGYGRGGPRRPVPIGRPIHVRPARGNSDEEVRAVRLMNAAFSDMRCERIGDAIRKLSNQVLRSMSNAQSPEIPGEDPRRTRLRRDAEERWNRVYQSRFFWTEIWDRLAEAYRSCDAECFDNGEAVGELSATMYCAANAGVGGLDAPGFLAQQPLPLCENSVFVGCQQEYRRVAREYPGCSTYSSGQYERGFLESISQDCHIDP